MATPARPYPMLEEAATHISDPMWQRIFLAGSTGILPKGFYFKGAAIFYKAKKKTALYLLPENAQACATGLKKFMAEQDGLMSELDRTRITTHNATATQQIELRRHLYNMLETFATSTLQKRYDLDTDEILFISVNLPWLFRMEILRPKDVIVKPNTTEILSVDGLDEDYFLQTRIWRVNTELQTNKSIKRSLRSDSRMA